MYINIVIVFQDAMQLKEANAVFSHFGTKVKKVIRVLRTIITSPGVQQLIIMTGINSGTTVKVRLSASFAGILSFLIS